MRPKDITVGREYYLVSSKKSKVGCAQEYFTNFKGMKMVVIERLNNFNAINNVLVRGFDHTKMIFIQFWCSAYDLATQTGK